MSMMDPPSYQKVRKEYQISHSGNNYVAIQAIVGGGEGHIN